MTDDEIDAAELLAKQLVIDIDLLIKERIAHLDDEAQDIYNCMFAGGGVYGGGIFFYC